MLKIVWLKAHKNEIQTQPKVVRVGEKLGG